MMNVHCPDNGPAPNEMGDRCSRLRRASASFFSRACFFFSFSISEVEAEALSATSTSSRVNCLERVRSERAASLACLPRTLREEEVEEEPVPRPMGAGRPEKDAATAAGEERGDLGAEASSG